MRRRVREQETDRGAAAVEFALVLVPLLLLVFGIIDFGRLYNEQMTLTSLARAGARMASLSPAGPDSTTAIKDRLIADAPAWLGLSADQITVQQCTAGASGPAAASATVTISTRFTLTIAQLANLDRAGVGLTGKGTMPCTG